LESLQLLLVGVSQLNILLSLVVVVETSVVAVVAVIGREP
jgi:hypothetical protein